jgi:beta-N-acetylhexosaminidase
MKSNAKQIDAGQVLIAGFRDHDPPDELMAAASLGHVGGFILFKRNLGSMRQVADLNRRLIEIMPRDFPPWITVDQEGGRVARLGHPVVAIPSMRVLGSIDQPSLTRDAAALLGRQLRKLGFNLDLAPVLDVDTNPANPVIGDRSFGKEPQRVARHGAAFISGLHQAGILACAKHFPGHGDTELDSHLALPRLTHNLERLNAVELAPFKAIIGEISVIMTAHIVCDAIDPSLPATLSRKVMTNLLREQLAYTGVVISDDMEMKAIADNFPIDDAVCVAIEAGCDALLICSHPDLLFQAHRALVLKAEKEPRFARRLREANERALVLRQRFPPIAATIGSDIEKELLAENPQDIEQRLAELIAATNAE